MISRDIDLTENLDFKRDTKERNKKSYELIPWNKRNKNIEDKKNNQSNSIISDQYTRYSISLYDFENISSYNINFSYNNGDMYTYSFDISDLYPTSNISYRSDHMDNMDSIRYVNCYSSSNTWTSRYNSVIHINSSDYLPKPLIPIFIQKVKEKIKSIKLPKRSQKYRYRSMPREFYSRDNKEIHNTELTSRSKSKESKSKDKRRNYWFSLLDKDSLENRVPWLSNLNGYILRDYLEELRNPDKDYSEYLTSSWFRPQG